MNNKTFSTTALLLALLPPAHGVAVAAEAQSPCYRVTIQNERVNQAVVEQRCEMNFSRTVQAGERNSTVTIQSGDVNNNRVRQYQYDPAGYQPRRFPDRPD